MRDFERWKDRVEISLEGRQIFFLFFGTAVAACLIFVAGVYVGRRIEQRNAPPPAAEDPLAALDQLEEEPDDGLTFHEALMRDGMRDKRTGRTESASAPPERPAAVPPPSPGIPAPNPVGERPSPRAPTQPAASADAARKPAEVGSSPRPADGRGAKPVDRVQSDARADARSVRPAGGHFTLQLSSFANPGDADSFARKLRGVGLRAQVIRNDVPGRGTVYRVRLGDYATRQAAEQARIDYEKKQHGNALVAPL